MQTEQRAAETLLNKGIKVRVSSPLLFRLFGKRQFHPVIRPPALGTIVRIRKEYLSAGLTNEDIQNIATANIDELVKKLAKPLSRIAAYGLLNSYWLGLLFGRLLGGYLYRHMDANEFTTAIKVIIMMGDRTDFTNIITLVAKMDITTPTMSQTTQGG
jgi:hypothetical protein